MSLRLFFVLCERPANYKVPVFTSLLILGGAVPAQGALLTHRVQPSYKGSYKVPVFIGGQAQKSPSHVAHVFATFLRAL